MKKQLKNNGLLFSVLGVGIVFTTIDLEINSDVLRRALLIFGVIIAALPVVYSINNCINKKSKS